MDEAAQASSILSKLESYEFSEIYTLFSDFLQPFSLLTPSNSQNPSKKPSRSKKPTQSSPSSSIRSLAKTFLPFVNRSISLLPKRLSESPKHPKTRDYVSQLLDCYKLCLECLDILFPELSGKPYCVHLQKCRYVHCLMRWERFGDAIDEGFRVLRDLGGVKVEGSGWKVSTGELVPRLIVVNGDEGVKVDGDFVHLIVDLAAVVAQSVSLSRVKDAGKYSGLLILLDEVRPWFRHLDTSVCSKLQWKLFAHMKNAALFLVKEVTNFKGNLVPEFCAAIFDEYTQLLKSQSIQGITTEEVEEFVKFVSNCSSKCRSACKTLRVSVAMHLYSSADKFSQDLLYFILIQKFHALGLYFHELCVEPNNSLSSTSEGSTGTHSVGLLPNDWDKLQDVSRLLSFGKNCYPSHLKAYDNPVSHNFRNCVEKASINSRTECKISKSFKSTNGEANLPFYLNALKFLCWPFADFVTSERKRIVMEDMGSPLGNALKRILEAFLEYSYLFPHCQQYSESRVEIDMIVLSISVACFTLSLKLNLMTEGSTGLVNYILSDKCTSLLRPQMLKYIIAMLHNSFVEFYRHEYLKEAFEALELCCRASWNHCLLLCEILVDKQKGVDGEISETMIAESVNEACKASSLLMDIGHRVDSRKVDNAIYSGLVKWYLAKNLLGQLSCPVTLIKHWAKTQCKLSKNTEDDAPILGTYLLHCPCLVKNKISTKIVGTVLEQELLAYQEMSKLYPKFCQKMQMKLIDTLLEEELYISSKCVRRSTILVKKGLLSRTFGIKGLDDCIQCLTEAINSVNGLSTLNDDVSNQLAVVYCLRALSRHEADPKSKDIFEDIHEAVGLWLRINIPCCSSNGNCEMGCEYVLQLLYHIADLLSIKGNMTLHSDVLSVIVKVFKQLNVPLEKCLSLLWESRRVNHALCAIPINETFIKDLSEQYDIKAESLEFWISCFKDSQPLLVGLLQNFSFLSSFSTVAYYQRKHSLQSEISIDEVEEIALNLLSSVSVSCSSVFLAGYLYHDLSERLCAGGRTIEALFFAKEAHRLRGKLLQEYFSCSIQQFDVNQELGESIRKSSALVSQLSVLNQIAIRAWPSNSISTSLDSSSITPWNVLRCYLESTLQVGIIHEILGNVAEAEAQFIIGNSISGLQCLPRFIVCFSTCLGKIYHGMGLLELAHKELATSEQNLDVEKNSLTCSRCLLMMESKINEQRGILLRKGDDCAPGNPYESSILRLISLEKSNIAVWLEGASAQHSAYECAAAKSGLDNVSRPTKTKAKLEAKRSRKTKKELETQATVNSCAAELSKRVTRSRKLSPNAKRAAFVQEGNNVTTCQTNGQLRTEAAVVSEKITCQKCFSSKLDLVGSLVCFIQMKWEFVRRRQILRLLIGLGKCQGALTETHRLHSIYSKCIYILLGGNDCHCSSSIDFDSISKEIPGDILVSERAEVLYDLCLLSLKALYVEDIRATGCHLCCIQMSHVLSFLKLSFVLSCEIPLLFQKVSRLLALVFVVSASKKNYSSLISCKALSESHWAAYFHQASIGSHHDLQLLSANLGKHRSQMVSKNEGYEAADVTSMITDTSMLIRTVPESTKDMESYVVKFFENLPSTTIVCVSILGASYLSLLKELMSYPSTVYGLILLSHFNADSQPAVVLLPISTVLQDEEPSSSCSIFGEKNVLKEWHSPWGSKALVDDVAPLFKLILRGNYLSCLTFPEERTEISRELWWTLRENLDKCLHNLLRNIEEVWFGQWRYLLLGRWLDTEPLNCAVKEFLHETNNDGCVLDINESIVKIVMGGIKSINMEKVKVSKLFLETGCFIGSLIDSVRGLDKEYDGVDYVSDLLIAAANQVELEYCNRREPVVLVLDSEIQMLPWESIPVMRDQEVYRMPSVASIFIALQRRCVLEEAARLGTKFPLIDPLDAFYLLNPSGDLSRTQSEFEEWFRLQNMQGKAGVVPSTEELSAALENHDLFLYFGHGSGAQYMPRDKIQKLENCSAILLMGCSSGSVNLNGCYAPVGTSLSYMLAGAPIVVANLWEVTDLDIDRFAKAALKSFLEERSMSSTDCIQCSLLAEAVESMSLNEKKGNPKKGRGKKKAVNPVPDVSGEYCYKHKLRAGYFVSQARKACKLPFLIGAAPVCYGVPTGIKKKREI